MLFSEIFVKIESNESAGNARRNLLAYPSLVCIEAKLNGKVDSSNFPEYNKVGNARGNLLAYPNLVCIEAKLNGKVDSSNFL